MRAGPLRHRATLQSKQSAPDGAGGHVDRWVELRKVWVEITAPSGRVATVANQLQAVVSAEIRARPATDLTPGRRLVHVRQGLTATYQIEAALPDNANSMLRLLCSSVPHP